jgi:hypothetical protein
VAILIEGSSPKQSNNLRGPYFVDPASNPVRQSFNDPTVALVMARRAPTRHLLRTEAGLIDSSVNVLFLSRAIAAISVTAA